MPQLAALAGAHVTGTATGRLRVPVDRVFPLERIVEAHAYAESGHVRGKVVVTVAD